jgi:uncharacterized protein YajQ (UPF0234 family)
VYPEAHGSRRAMPMGARGCTLGAMAKDESFDITTGCDLQEVANAVNQARKEISTRFDFKNVVAEIDYDHGATKMGLHAADDYKLEAMWQVLMQRLIARNVPVKNLVRGTAQKASAGTIRQDVTLVQGIEQDIAKKIVKFVKDQKYKKAQAQIQGDAVRVSSPSRDELQQVITDLKQEDYGIELKFGNFR